MVRFSQIFSNLSDSPTSAPSAGEDFLRISSSSAWSCDSATHQPQNHTGYLADQTETFPADSFDRSLFFVQHGHRQFEYRPAGRLSSHLWPPLDTQTNLPFFSNLQIYSYTHTFQCKIIAWVLSNNPLQPNGSRILQWIYCVCKCRSKSSLFDHNVLIQCFRVPVYPFIEFFSN